MKKYFLWGGVVLAIVLVGATGFYFLSGKNSAAPTPAETAVPAPPEPFSFRGALADLASSIGNKVADIVSPSAPAPAPPSGNTTNSTPANPASFSFAILGDSRHFGSSPTGGLQLAVAFIEKQNVSTVVAMGDLIDNCDGGAKCQQKFTNWKNIVGPLMPKTYAVNGNHDCTAEPDIAIWRKLFNFPTNGPSGFEKMAYSFNVGNSHFVVLDTENPSAHKVDPAERAWLDQDLSATNQENTFVFYHEPAFPSSTEVADGLDAKTEDRDALWKIIDKHNVTAVFNGHEHLYARWLIDSSVFSGAKNKIEQIVVGDTDVNDPDTPQSGQNNANYVGKSFAIVDVNGKNITLKVYSVDGKLVDNFTFSK